jgi:hypothetical protein
MAARLDLDVYTNAHFFKVGRLNGIIGSFRIAKYKTLFLIFKLFRCKYILTIEARRALWTR